MFAVELWALQGQDVTDGALVSIFLPAPLPTTKSLACFEQHSGAGWNS
jgi:hypothetical protein